MRRSLYINLSIAVVLATVCVGAWTVRVAEGERLAVAALFSTIVAIQIGYSRRVMKSGDQIGSFASETEPKAPAWGVALFCAFLGGIGWMIWTKVIR